MDAPIPLNLTRVQKLQLAASVFAIYWPIRLYLNIDQWSWRTFQYSWLIWILEIPLTILFFTGWLSVTEWLEKKIVRQPGQNFLIDVKWPAQLARLVVAGALAILFNLIFHILIFRLNNIIDSRQAHQAAIQAPAVPVAQDMNQKRLDYARRARANNGLTVMAMLMAFYLAANRRGYQALTGLKVNAEQLKREATQAQFVALKNQVSPHFLFNSLSILSSLVEVDPKLSVRFISHLSKVYRYILEQRDSERVSLKTELDFLNAYAFLLNIRFEGKLLVQNRVAEPVATRYGIAPLTLQLLVENAVKHNQMSQAQPLLVTIDTEDDYLIVRNPLQTRPQTEESTGLGLENIRNRYRLLTDRPMSAGEEDNAFVVKIPLLS